MKKYIFVSGITLLLGITFINKFYNLQGTILPKEDNDFTVMSYNVRLLINLNGIPRQIYLNKLHNLFPKKNPDILCIQEYSEHEKTRFSNYPYKQVFKEGKNIIVGNAIFSKYKILDKGKISFPGSSNNVVLLIF